MVGGLGGGCAFGARKTCKRLCRNNGLVAVELSTNLIPIKSMAKGFSKHQRLITIGRTPCNP
jgi:hypothetical protein